MLLVAFVAFIAVVVAQQQQPPQQPPQQQQPPPQPHVDWGRCPQLSPKDAEREQKSAIVAACVQQLPAPKGEVTQQTIDEQRAQIAFCALEAEGWFTRDGKYRFEKAKQEILNKKLSSDVEAEVLVKHDDCEKETLEKYENGGADVIAAVSLYQACMDFHLSEVCGIKIIQ